jgi:hypothetical protein
MDESAINWVCRLWNEAKTRQDWYNLNHVFQGAGMAVYHLDTEAGMDYWALSDLAMTHYLGDLA